MVSTRTHVGSIGILANHQPLLACSTRPSCGCTSRSPTSCASPRARATSRWPATACSCSSRRLPPDDLDAADLRDRLQRAEDELSSAEEGSEERRAAERDKRRAEAFLKLADADSSSRAGLTA